MRVAPETDARVIEQGAEGVNELRVSVGVGNEQRVDLDCLRDLEVVDGVEEVAALAFGLMTCCLGFLLLMVPYISSVLVLPISVFYRSFTFEFLAQFDDGLLPSSTPSSTPEESSPESQPPLAEATV